MYRYKTNTYRLKTAQNPKKNNFESLPQIKKLPIIYKIQIIQFKIVVFGQHCLYKN
jgi:hypothetical protein